jgi:predicted HD superfamily hydrolase involved in NAD metabolism
MEFEQIHKKVKETLSEKRYNHSVCTMEMCEKLAKIYNVDMMMAKMVGIAHDIAKEIPEEEKLKYCEDNNIPVNEIERNSIALLHGKIGADICKKEFDFTEEMVDAIRYHSTGKPNFSMLGKILYIADGTGLDRDYIDVEILEDLRQKAVNNIDEAIIKLLEISIIECIGKQKALVSESILWRNEILIARITNEQSTKE